MNKVIVIADSTADLSPELVEKYKVRVVPLHVTFPKEGVDYLDGVTITPQQLYDKVKELGETPKSGAINIQEFIDYFKPYIDDGCDIIFTGIGSDCLRQSTMQQLHQGNSLKAELKSSILKIYPQVQVF